jgi:hypothetical protein
MLTLEETLAEQEDLHRLCADRSLKTRECFAPNAFYGYDFIFKTYADLPLDYPLKVVLPHGVSAAIAGVWDEEVKISLPVIFAYRDKMRDLYVQASKKFESPKKIVLAATPILYVLELLKDHPQPERKGTIFFPAHSAHFATVKMDFEALAEQLMQLDERYKPITVCVYWKDFNLGHHLPFQKRGMNIVSAGHVFEPYFLFRFYHLCSMHLYSAGNSSGSSLFYSVKSGCSFFYLDTINYSLEVDSQDPEKGRLSCNIGVKFASKSLFTSPRPSMTEEQMKVIDYYLGTDYFKSPQKLRRQLLHAELLDKTGFFIRNRHETLTFAWPPSYYRNKERWVQKLRETKHRVLLLRRKL